MEENHVLPYRELSFRRSIECIDALTFFATMIQNSFSPDEYAGCIFLDFRKAYDSINVDILKDKPVKFELRDRMTKNIVDIFRDRKTYVCGEF
ncbi:hypothetical protein Trydic_g21148 [Trypoxylus dichotomus]